ncbi:protein BPS1, chloroplastic-like [Andrographis paniculata]|uniref:protein BPS1, chloroplastic-like n=1 Tax=Andrographis paniculata TaxID=175694 RepID=UPI0021E8934C|nr:protein BPS1, chloroplastic-like [Andrographis paniculata]
MNNLQVSERTSGNPFRRIIPKGTSLSPKLLRLLNSFEETLAQNIENIKPENRGNGLTLSWMRSAIESLSAIHADVKDLITALELPISAWDDKWINVYLDNSVKLLDICIAFSSEISRLKQGHLFLHSALHNLTDQIQIHRACSSLAGWRQHISSKNPRLEKCFSIMDSLARMLDLPKIKNSSKGKVLMRALYGIKVVTLFICSVFAAALSGSSAPLIEVNVPSSYFWSKAFTNLQTSINTEIRSGYLSGGFTVLKEAVAVDMFVKQVYPIIENGFDPDEVDMLLSRKADLQGSVEELSLGLDSLAKEMDGFFQVVLTGRDALLCNLRVVGVNVIDRVRADGDGNRRGQVVR